MLLGINPPRYHCVPPLGLQANPSHPITRRLVASYLFNEQGGGRLNDTSRYLNRGDFEGSATWSNTRYGYAVSFNGTDAAIDLGNPIVLQVTDDITIEVIWLSNGSSAQQLVAKDKDSGGRAFTLDLVSTAQTVRFYLNGGGGSDLVQATSLATNTKHHTVATYRSSDKAIAIYNNGILAQSATASSGSIPTATSNVHIGRREYAGNLNYFSGYIYLVRIWNRALDAKEAQQLYFNPYEMFTPPKRRVFIGLTATQYTLSLGGTITPAGSIVKADSKALSGGFTPTGGLSKVAQKALAGALTPGGLATTLRTIVQLAAGQITPVGSVVKNTSALKSGALTPVGSSAKTTSKPATGSSTPSGATVKIAMLTLIAAIIPSGLLSKAISLLKSGNTTPLGTPSKTTVKPTAGSLTPTGAIETIRAVLRSFTGVITPTGAATRQANKSLDGSIQPVGARQKRAGKTTGGAIALTGETTRFRTAYQFLAGNSTPSAARLKIIAKTMAGSLAPVGSVAKIIYKVLTGSITATGLLITEVIPGFIKTVALTLRKRNFTLTLAGRTLELDLQQRRFTFTPKDKRVD